MAAENLTQVLIEGFDPSKVQATEVDENWKKVFGAYQNQTILQAPIIGIEKQLDKQCAVVSVGSIRGYIPMELTGVETIRQLRSMTGQAVLFKVLNYDRDASIFTASRKAAVEQAASITLKRIEPGDTIVAVVSHVNQTQVRADIGGIEVRIPIEDISYGWIDNLTDKVKLGDHLSVKVMEIDKENAKVKVSAKEAEGNPWPSCAGRYQKGNEYVGTVSGVREYGVFVNLEPGVDCLSRHLKFQDVHKGERVLVRVLETDVKKEQIRSRITRVL
ncbi:S1 RNA-binding domain-containing protein [Domibacillus sp. PGB-M46]|uniref:S1 RNA-binding domain-containing protein n=1 Tax=Domibacillus sp. PGB-M46 TaxID=2910255 RepID=UPI001F573943|nr:S1 RNA-binding domain-containing protein [Domibacillus sp. PGB-M46]MCI2257205.1 S1 RNA-binding domain-containing protein [Domibacillus sp. PGB-M46]